MKPKVIIDTDAGIDDAMAIFMVLDAHVKGELDVVAITTVSGNTNVENVNKNVLRILQTTNLLSIPVYPGASNQLVVPFVKPDPVPCHGNDGFGDADHEIAGPSLSLLQSKHAVTAMLQIIDEHPGEVIMLALGPLTNIALALGICPHFTTKFRDFYIMGGNVTGAGNITSCAEFNFCCDPEAAKVVLDRTKCLIKLTPWETCLHGLILTYGERNEFGNTGTPVAALLNKIEAQILKRKQFEYWCCCDQITAAWMLDDLRNQPNVHLKLAMETKEISATVETQGIHTRGQMVVLITNMKPPTNVVIISAVNKPTFINILVTMFRSKFNMEK